MSRESSEKDLRWRGADGDAQGNVAVNNRIRWNGELSIMVLQNEQAKRKDEDEMRKEKKVGTWLAHVIMSDGLLRSH